MNAFRRTIGIHCSGAETPDAGLFRFDGQGATGKTTHAGAERQRTQVRAGGRWILGVP